MWKLAVIGAALLAFSAPTLAQNSPTPPATTDQQDTTGISPGGLLLGGAGLGLAAWGIIAATKKSNNNSSSPASP